MRTYAHAQVSWHGARHAHTRTYAHTRTHAHTRARTRVMECHHTRTYAHVRARTRLMKFRHPLHVMAHPGRPLGTHAAGKGQQVRVVVKEEGMRRGEGLGEEVEEETNKSTPDQCNTYTNLV